MENKNKIRIRYNSKYCTIHSSIRWDCCM